MGEGLAFQVMDRLAVVSDISTTNRAPSDIERASVKRRGRAEE